MANHAINLLNKRKRLQEKSIKNLRGQLLCNKLLRKQLAGTLANLKAARRQSDFECDFATVSDLHRGSNMVREELSRQLLSRLEIIDELQNLSASYRHTLARIKEELADEA